MSDYKGKTAFITGAANGVGLGMAIAFAKEGINVIMSDIRKADLEKSVEEVKKYNKNVYTIAVDVSDRNAIKEAADEAEKAFGKIHILCNNAGIISSAPLTRQHLMTGTGCLMSVSGARLMASCIFCQRSRRMAKADML